MESIKPKVIETHKSSLKDMAGFVIASSVFKRMLAVYAFVVFLFCPLLVLVVNFWTVTTEQTFLSFALQSLLPVTFLMALVAGLHFVFQAYVTAREYSKRTEEFESYDAFCEARWTEMGQPSGFVSFPIRFWPGFFGTFIFVLSMITIFNRFFE